MKYSINLLPDKELNFTDKAVYFAFHYLRYILVITQFVVICVFFYRFKVDQEIVDLKDNLKNKQEIVQATNSLIKEVDTINKHIEGINSVLTKQTDFQALYSYFFQDVPAGVELTEIVFTSNSVDCQGMTPDVNSVRIWYEGLKSGQKFEEVKLQNVNKTETGYTFSLSLKNYTNKTP